MGIKIKFSHQIHVTVLLTAQSSLLTQAVTDLPGSRKPVMKPTAVTVIHKTLFLSLRRGSLWCLHQVFHSIPAIHKVREDFYHPIIARSTKCKASGAPCPQWFWVPSQVLGSELDLTVD